DVVLTGIAFATPDAHVDVAGAFTMPVIARFADGRTLTVPASLLTLTSAQPGVARFSDVGSVVGLAAGVTPVFAAFGGFTAATTITVGPPQPPLVLDVYPSSYALVAGAERAF